MSQILAMVLVAGVASPVVGEPVIGPKFQISSIGVPVPSLTAVAFNGTIFLVVWPDGRNAERTGTDVYAARVRASDGVVLDPEGILLCNDPGDQRDVSVASNGDDFLVAWGGAGVIDATRVDGSTGLQTGRVRIDSGDGVDRRVWQPAVIAEGETYLIKYDWGNSDGFNGTLVSRIGSSDSSVLLPFGVTLCAEGCPVTLSSNGSSLRATIDDTYGGFRMLALSDNGQVLHSEHPFPLDGGTPSLTSSATAAVPAGNYLTFANGTRFLSDPDGAILATSSSPGNTFKRNPSASFDGASFRLTFDVPRGTCGMESSLSGESTGGEFEILVGSHGSSHASTVDGMTLVAAVDETRGVVGVFLTHGGDQIPTSCDPTPSPEPTPESSAAPAASPTPDTKSGVVRDPTLLIASSAAAAQTSDLALLKQPRNRGGGCSVGEVGAAPMALLPLLPGILFVLRRLRRHLE